MTTTMTTRTTYTMTTDHDTEGAAQAKADDTAAQNTLDAFLAFRKASGPKLKRQDLRKIFRAYVNSGVDREIPWKPYRSYQHVADAIGLISVGSVHAWMKEDFPEIAKAMARGVGSARATKEPQSAETTNEAEADQEKV